jgi:hypothetical protein
MTNPTQMKTPAQPTLIPAIAPAVSPDEVAEDTAAPASLVVAGEVAEDTVAPASLVVAGEIAEDTAALASLVVAGKFDSVGDLSSELGNEVPDGTVLAADNEFSWCFGLAKWRQ